MAQPERPDVLLVEDERHDADFVLDLLAEHAFDRPVHVARDGAEALDYMFCRGRHAGRRPGEQPRVVLLDLKLPGIDGYEVLRQLKIDPRTCATPVIVLTASARSPDLARCYALGASGHIVKPLSFESLDQAMRLVDRYWLARNHDAPRPSGATLP